MSESGKEFADDIALVTGATNGIGLGVAKALAREGAGVVVAGVTEEEVAGVTDDIARSGGMAFGAVADLSSGDGWKSLLSSVRDTVGTVSIFVHSASPLRKEAQTVSGVSEQEWDAMMNTNVRSGFFLARELAADMTRQRIRGRMLFITSQHRYTPRNLPHYSAAKAAQVMVVRELARALGPYGIRVNGIAPGAIPGGGFTAAAFPELEGKIALGRMGTPEDIAGAAMALLSERYGGYITGEIVSVDGGLALYNWIDPPSGE